MEATDDFKKEVERIKALAESVESFQVQLDAEQIRQIVTKLALNSLKSWPGLENLPFKSQPVINLIDRRVKDVEGFDRIWDFYSELYHSRLAEVFGRRYNDNASVGDYKIVSTGGAIIPMTTLEADRPLSTPSLGTASFYVDCAVWDDTPLAFTFQSDRETFFDTQGQWYNDEDDDESLRIRNRHLYVLIGTHDRVTPIRETGKDLLRRFHRSNRMWKPKYHPRGEVNAISYGWGSHWLKGDVRPVLLNQEALESEHKEEIGKASIYLEGDTGLDLSTYPTSTSKNASMAEATSIQSVEIVHLVSPSEHTSEDEYDTVEEAIPTQSAKDVLPVLPTHRAIESEHESVNDRLPINPNSHIHRVLSARHMSEDDHRIGGNEKPKQLVPDIRTELSTQYTFKVEHEIANEPVAVQDAHGVSSWKRLRDYLCF